MSAGYVEFSDLGDPNDAAAGQLLSAAQRVYEPRKVVHFEQPRRYPERERPALYICNDDACSLSIHNAELVREEARKFTPVAFTEQTGGLRRLDASS
ncbi:MAG: hypothetical protein VCB59_11970 [Gammaproteobacteria bacterium]